MSNPKDYTIGWICAIKTEYVAAQAFLDEEHDGPETVSPHDNNDYTLGKIGKHNVVIAVLPNGEYGISPATAVARDMLHSFPNVRIGLMVGIGGGAPSQKHDIRLGDIVVSAPSGGGGGVFQYDFGKTIQDQSFQTTGFLDQPPMVLRTAVSGLQAQYERKGHQLEEAINDALRRYPRLREDYKRQDQTTDRLYKSEVVHRSAAQGSCDNICGSDSSSLIFRLPRAKDKDNPAIHYGLIASANKLMQDALIRDALSADKDVLCFEMEAAGLMNHFPCLVVRGICDYADSHKSFKWQGYAAMAAAAYTKDLLCRIVPNKVEAEKKLGDILSGVLDTLSSTIVHVETIKSKLVGDKDLEVLNWLTPTNYGPQHSDFIKRRQEGTGEWLLSSPKYLAWREIDKQTLFCHGIPGAGKTILASVIIEDLNSNMQHDTNVGIAFIYCNFRLHDQQKDDDLRISLLKQLSEQRQALPDCIKALFSHHNDSDTRHIRHTRPSSDEISRNLQTVAAMYSKVFIIVDALDECQVIDGSRKRLLTEIFNLQANCKVSFLATSRPIPNIIEIFTEDTRLEIRATKEDLRRYLEGQSSLLPSCVRRNPQLEEEVKVTILQAVDGMFLLAQLHLDSLRGKTSPKAIREALKKLPAGSDAYDNSYEEAMERIEGQLQDQKKLAKQVISWISCSKRPLTSSELEHALAVDIGDSELDRENITRIDDMVAFCAGLVTVDKESGITRLVHYTTQEFFDRTRGKWFPNIQTEMTRVCATYLSFDKFESGPCRNDKEFGERLEKYRLYDYASHYWGIHAREAAASSTEVITFLKKPARVEASAQALLVKIRLRFHSQLFPKQMTGLHLIAYFGIRDIATVFLLHGAIDLKASDGMTPLLWAARNGHEAVVKLLLDTGEVDVDSKEFAYSHTPLLLAAQNGHAAIVKLLLDTGDVDVDTKPLGYSQTPLWWAAINGHEAAVKLLLDTGMVDADLEDSDGRTPLSWAAHNGHEAVVKLLLDTGMVDADLEDSDGKTPLWWAAQNGHDAVVKLLLDTGEVDVDLKDSEYSKTPMWWAAANKGHVAVVKLLLDTGELDVDLKDSRGRTLLSWAAEKGHKSVVKLLLDTEEVDVDLKDSVYGQTPLSWAACNGHEAVVKLLLNTGKVEVDSKDSNGQTSLLWAAKNGHEAVMTLLLGTREVDVNLKDFNGQTMLSWAAENGRKAVVKLLLHTEEVDVDLKDSQYDQTPLSWAAENGHEAVVKLLLDTGKVDVNSKDSNGRTPLSFAAANGHEAVVKLILDTGEADVGSKDSIGRTPLSWAAKKGHELTVKLLLDTGKVDVDSKDSNGWTPLTWAAKKGHESTVKLLLDTGMVDADLEDSGGKTPLSWATENGHEVVVKLLLDKRKVNLDSEDRQYSRTPLLWATENGTRRS